MIRAMAARVHAALARRRRTDGPIHAGEAERGLTLIEVLIVMAIMVTLAAAAIPIAKASIKRHRELELRRALRDMRYAIDEYKRIASQGMIVQTDVESEGYPPDLESLMEGTELVGGRRMKFLRRIPLDPMTGEEEWGKRSYQDDHDSRSWGRQNLYDIYSLSQGTALDGTLYEDW